MWFVSLPGSAVGWNQDDVKVLQEKADVYSGLIRKASVLTGVWWSPLNLGLKVIGSSWEGRAYLWHTDAHLLFCLFFPFHHPFLFFVLLFSFSFSFLILPFFLVFSLFPLICILSFLSLSHVFLSLFFLFSPPFTLCSSFPLLSSPFFFSPLSSSSFPSPQFSPFLFSSPLVWLRELWVNLFLVFCLTSCPLSETH